MTLHSVCIKIILLTFSLKINFLNRNLRGIKASNDITKGEYGSLKGFSLFGHTVPKNDELYM